MSTAAAIVLFVGVTAYALFGGADFGAGFWDLTAGGTERGETAPRGDRSLDRPGVGGGPRLADLLLRGAVDVLPGGLRVDHADPVRSPDARRLRHRAARSRASRSARPCFRTRDRRNFGAAFAISSVLVPYCLGTVAGAIASGRVPAGGQAGRSRGQLGEPHLDRRWGPRRVRRRLPRGDLPGVGRPPPVRRPHGASTSGAARSPRGSWLGAVALVGIFVLRADAEYLFDGLTSRALPLVILSAVGGVASLLLLHRRNHRGARIAAIVAVGSVVVAWGVAQWDYILPESLTVARGRGPERHHHRGARRDRSRRGAHRPGVRACSTSSTSAVFSPRNPSPKPDTHAARRSAPCPWPDVDDTTRERSVPSRVS